MISVPSVRSTFSLPISSIHRSEAAKEITIKAGWKTHIVKAVTEAKYPSITAG